MGCLKGKREFLKFERGEKLSWKGAVRAQCYICNGEDEGAEDCLGVSCPLYPFFPYKGMKRKDTSNNESKSNLEPESGTLVIDGNAVEGKSDV